MSKAAETPLALYIHWPFCRAKCPYCDFNSHVSQDVDHARFAAAYRREMAAAETGNEAEWATQKLIQQQAMELANHNEQELRKMEAQRNLAVIKEQMAAQRQRTDFGKKDKFGAVEPGFFDKFGADCR